MKIATIAMGIGLGAFLMTGCNNDQNNSEKNPLVGFWTEGCRSHRDGFQKDNIRFTADGKFEYHRLSYDEDDCSGDSTDHNDVNGTYESGGSFKDSHDKSTTGLTLEIPNEGKMYTMYRFKTNGNLVIADSTDERDGSSEETRKNDINPNWEGYTIQQ